VYHRGVVSEVIETYAKCKRLSDADFAQSREEKKSGRTKASIYYKRKKAKSTSSSREAVLKNKFSEDVASGKLAAAAGGRLSSGTQLIGQKHAVIIIVHDLRPDTLKHMQDAEPLVFVLGAFDTVEEAVRYIKQTAYSLPECKPYTFDVIEMQQWLFPEAVEEEKLNESYVGNAEQNALMNFRKTERTRVSEYTNWMAENKYELKDPNFLDGLNA
jgi:hypothetical protein